MDLETLAWKIAQLEKENQELEERIADLELQVANLTERALHSSCVSCGMH